MQNFPIFKFQDGKKIHKRKCTAMNDLDNAVFTELFKKASQDCFGHPITEPLSETESKLLSNKIFDQTGLIIGAKSIKNYSFFVLRVSDAKEENPSMATLDTLARYVLKAPYTDEVQRKNTESHYPYWFQFKDQFIKAAQTEVKPKRKIPRITVPLLVTLIAFLSLFLWVSRKPHAAAVTEDFHTIAEDSLFNHGWFVQEKEAAYWNRRGEKPGHLTLFTLKGDNWPDSSIIPGIKNLLLRKITADCFTIEVRLADFIPLQNWQQAGILLLEDTSFEGKSMRISIVHNSYFGGYAKKPEILVQAITSMGKNSKPEEIIHKTLFTLEDPDDSLVTRNLRQSALRIEKHGHTFRLLYTVSPVENFAFTEAVKQEFSMKPKYAGIFAMKGQVDSAAIIPASFRSFNFTPLDCD